MSRIPEIPEPRVLADDLSEVRRLHPTQMSVTEQLTGPSEASITLSDRDEAPAMHALVEIWTARGCMGVYRITNIGRNYRNDITLTLRHGIDTLADSLWREQAEFSGTVTQFLTKLLTFQTAEVDGAAPWVLGSCACTANVQKTMNYDRLSALWSGVEEDNPGFHFVYDQTTTPWTASFVADEDECTAGFRLNRNAQDCSVTFDDSEMCNKLRVSANRIKTGANGAKTVETAFFDYANTDSQEAWGVIEKVADIEVHEDVKGGAHAETDAWAAKFLARRGEPSVQIEITGLALKRLTNDDWDLPVLGKLAAVDLPDYGQAAFAERVMSVTWTDPLGEPLACTVSLSNVRPKFSETLAQVRNAAGKAGRAAARAAREAKVATSWQMIVQDIEDTVSGTGLKTLYETGIILDAKDGATIYSLMEGLQALNAILKISHNGVQSLVMASGAKLNADGTPVLDQDGHVVFDTLANCLYSQITQAADEITSQVIQMGTVQGLQEFDATKAYAVGDLVLHNHRSYRFKTAHAANTAWNDSEVEAVVPALSRITQTEDGVDSLVTKTGVNSLGQGETLYSRISQTESDINLVVENTAGGGRQVSKAALLLAINGSGGSTAYLEADQVKLSASGGSTVTLDDKIAVLESQSFTNTNLYVAGDIYAMTPGGSYHAIAGAVVIPEGKLLTFNQTGNNVNVYAADMAAMKTGFTSVTGSESGGQVTLTFGRADGSTAGTVTFNRATASKVSGGWSSGNYVVSADPNGSDLPLTLAVTNTLGGVSNTTYVQASDQWLGDVTATPAVGGASGTGATYQIDVRDAVLKGREIGWADAAGAIVWPGAGTGQSFSVTAPSGTPDTTFPRSFTLSESGGYIYCSSDGKNVARYQYPARSYSVTEAPNRSGKLAPSGYSQLGSTITGYNTGHTFIQFTITANGTAHKYYIDVNVP